MWDHTCHITQVNTPCLNLSQTGQYLICLSPRDGRLNLPRWLVTVTHPNSNEACCRATLLFAANMSTTTPRHRQRSPYIKLLAELMNFALNKCRQRKLITVSELLMIMSYSFSYLVTDVWLSLCPRIDDMQDLCLWHANCVIIRVTVCHNLLVCVCVYLYSSGANGHSLHQVANTTTSLHLRPWSTWWRQREHYSLRRRRRRLVQWFYFLLIALYSTAVCGKSSSSSSARDCPCGLRAFAEVFPVPTLGLGHLNQLRSPQTANNHRWTLSCFVVVTYCGWRNKTEFPSLHLLYSYLTY